MGGKTAENQRRCRTGRQPGDQRLTPRKTRFVEAFLETGCGSRAAVTAGYAGRPANAAWRLLNRDKAVMAAVAQSHTEIQKRAEISAASMLEQLAEDRRLAIANKQFSAAVKASELQAKMAGLLIDRQDVRSAAQIRVEIVKFGGD